MTQIDYLKHHHLLTMEPDPDTLAGAKKLEGRKKMIHILQVALLVALSVR